MNRINKEKIAALSYEELREAFEHLLYNNVSFTEWHLVKAEKIDNDSSLSDDEKAMCDRLLESSYNSMLKVMDHCKPFIDSDLIKHTSRCECACQDNQA